MISEDALANAKAEKTKQEINCSLDSFSLHCDEIVPGVFLGSESSAVDVNLLKKYGITHILIPAHTSQPRLRHPGVFTYLIWDAYDVKGYPLIWCFDVYCELIEEALRSGGKVLVHCANGVSRSPAIVCAYLLREARKGNIEDTLGVEASVTVCFSFIKKIRTQVSDRKFKDQLELYNKLGLSLEKYSYLVKSNHLTEEHKGIAEVEELNKFYSIRKVGKMREAFLATKRTLWLANDDI